MSVQYDILILMPSIFKYKLIYHPTFHNGVILSDVSSRADTYVDVFFFESENVKQFKKSFLEEKCLDAIKLKLSDILSSSLIELLFDSFTINKGNKYVSDSRIKIEFMNDYRVVAKVIGTIAYSVEIECDKGKLDFSCSCPVSIDECKHVYALMKYILMRFEGKEIEEVTPFEEVFNQMSLCKEKKFFDLGFEACILYLEKRETSTKILSRYLKAYDYYSNKAFIPLVLNEGINECVSSLADYETKARFNKIRARYLKALDRRNYSFEDVLLAHIFTKEFEKIFSYNFEHSYLSSLSKEALIYAALHCELTPKIAATLSKFSLSMEEVRALYNHADNKASKKYFYMSYRSFFLDLSEEEINELEYTSEDIYEMYLSSSILAQPRIIIGNYNVFIKEKKEDYLAAMILDTLSHIENKRKYFLELYNIIAKLSDNALLKKLDYSGDRTNKDAILNRWRGYNDFD